MDADITIECLVHHMTTGEPVPGRAVEQRNGHTERRVVRSAATMTSVVIVHWMCGCARLSYTDGCSALNGLAHHMTVSEPNPDCGAMPATASTCRGRVLPVPASAMDVDFASRGWLAPQSVNLQ